MDANTVTVDPVEEQDGDILVTCTASKKGTLYIAGPSHVKFGNKQVHL